jgi:hypothetical protein
MIASDLYANTAGEGIAYSINRSFAFLVDVGGNDTYRAPKGAPGTARFDPRFADREAIAGYWVEASSMALFLDIGGKDDYGDAAAARDGATWGDGEGSENWAVRNVGVGADISGGAVDWTALPMRGRAGAESATVDLVVSVFVREGSVHYRFGARETDDDAKLAGWVIEAGTAGPPARVLLRASRDVPWVGVARVLERISGAGILRLAMHTVPDASK